MQASLPGATKDLFQRMLRGSNHQKYNASLRAFALTLHFYSPKAYSFVRDTFNKSLPHPVTIIKWYKTVGGAPGFSTESLNTLQEMVRTQASKGLPVLCNLVMDEMSIRKQIEWTGKVFTGHVNFGINFDSDEVPAAREVLVFMLVCLNASWKIPVGYFFLNGLSGNEKATLIKHCLQFVHESGVVVTSVTFDGAPANLTMAQELGADFNKPFALKTYFIHPSTNEKVFIILDPCHG